MASIPTKLMTFAEFERLPTPKAGRLELRHGEPVTLPPPKWKHQVMQERLRSLLAAGAVSAGVVLIEVGFRVSDRDYRVADVGFVARDRAQQTDPDGYLPGAPDIVIEVLSPSNTIAELLDKERICLENGAREFWIVDLENKQVKVSAPDGHTLTYKSRQEIPLLFGGALTVDAIFA